MRLGALVVQGEVTRWMGREAWPPIAKQGWRQESGVYHFYTAGTASGCKQQEAWSSSSSKAGNMPMNRGLMCDAAL